MKPGSSWSSRQWETRARSPWKSCYAHKFAFESRVGEKVSASHPIFAWMVELCADVYNRCHIGRDGKTDLQRLRGRRGQQLFAELGAPVLFRASGKVKGSNMGERWFMGVFLGKKANTEEHLVMRENGQLRKQPKY